MSLATQTEDAIVKFLADELELDMIWARFDKTTLEQERQFKPVIRRQFNSQEAEVLSNVARSVLSFDGTDDEIQFAFRAFCRHRLTVNRYGDAAGHCNRFFTDAGHNPRS